MKFNVHWELWEKVVRIDGAELIGVVDGDIRTVLKAEFSREAPSKAAVEEWLTNLVRSSYPVRPMGSYKLVRWLKFEVTPA